MINSRPVEGEGRSVTGTCEMDVGEISRSLGRIEGTLAAIHEEVKNHNTAIRELRLFNAKLKGAATFSGIAAAAATAAAGLAARMKGIF